MKKIYALPLFLLFPFAAAVAQQNVGIGTNNPETKLQVNGALSLTPATLPAAANVVIPDNVSVFRLGLSTGGSTSALSIANPKEGQMLTIYNEDDNTATFIGNTIMANTGVVSFIYVNNNWRLTASNSISGPAGPQGPAGPAGANGAQGPAGPAGAQGPTGATGQQGAQGVAGPVGPQGPAGANGAQGPAGPAGAQGPTGATGQQGAQGVAGPVGPQGPAGANGAQGPAGPAGAQGPQGLQGTAGANGAQGPAGPAGAQGPAGLLSAGSAAGNTTYWDGSTWVLNSNNIYNNGGNVGIGSTAPASKLEVAATIAHAYPTPGQTFGTMHIKPLSSSTADQSASLTFGAAQGQGGAQAGIYVQSSGSYGTKMYFGTTNAYATGSQSRMMIDHAGNVGIGNIAPGYKLHVSGDILADGGWLRSNGARGWYNDTYGGGMYMTDVTWVRAYNNKSIWSAATIQADGNMYTPIMYDLNNTGYYVDPSSASRLNTLTVSRDNTTECCSGADNYTLAIAEATNATARQASISFHNSGESESFIRLAGGGSGARAGQRRLVIGDNQNSATTLQVQALAGTGAAPVYADANGIMYRSAGGAPYGNNVQSVKGTTNISTASNTYADIAEMTITFTPVHSTVFVSGSLNATCGSGSQQYVGMRIVKDNAEVAQTFQIITDYDDYWGSANGGHVAFASYPVSVTPGVATTIKLQWRTGGLYASTALNSAATTSYHRNLFILD